MIKYKKAKKKNEKLINLGQNLLSDVCKMAYLKKCDISMREGKKIMDRK